MLTVNSFPVLVLYIVCVVMNYTLEVIGIFWIVFVVRLDCVLGLWKMSVNRCMK